MRMSSRALPLSLKSFIISAPLHRRGGAVQLKAMVMHLPGQMMLRVRPRPGQCSSSPAAPDGRTAPYRWQSRASAPAGSTAVWLWEPYSPGAAVGRNMSSATSRSPLSRAPPPVNTNPAPRISCISAWRRWSRSNSISSRARGSSISPNMRCCISRDGRSPTDGIDLVAFRNTRHNGAAEHLLDVLGVGNRSTEADAHIVGEMVAADRNGPAVNHHAFEVDDEVSRSGANVHRADAQLALVGLKHRVGTSLGLEDRVVHMDSGVVQRRDHVLSGGGSGGHEWTRASSFLPIKPAGSWTPPAVDDELLGKQVQRFAIVGHGDAAGPSDCRAMSSRLISRDASRRCRHGCLRRGYGSRNRTSACSTGLARRLWAASTAFLMESTALS